MLFFQSAFARPLKGEEKMERDFLPMIQKRFDQGLHICLNLGSRFSKMSFSDRCNYVESVRHLVSSFRVECTVPHYDLVPVISNSNYDADAIILDPYCGGEANKFSFINCQTASGGLYGTQKLFVQVTPNMDEELFDRLMRENEHNMLQLYLYVAYKASKNNQGLIMSIKNVRKIFQVRRLVGKETIIYLSDCDPLNEVTIKEVYDVLYGPNLIFGLPAKTSPAQIMHINRFIQK